jgi:hypothetical protein
MNHYMMKLSQGMKINTTFANGFHAFLLTSHQINFISAPWLRIFMGLSLFIKKKKTALRGGDVDAP